MKKAFILIILAAMLVLLFAGCAGSAGQTPAASENKEAASPNNANAVLKGEKFETDKFSLIVPEGWEKMEVDGGVQIYKQSGEVFELHFRGSNQNEDHAKQQAQSLAKQFKGSEPKEVDLLGKRFWTTSFTAGGVAQVTYLRMEDGVLNAVKYAGPDYENNPDFKAILDSVVFK